MYIYVHKYVGVCVCVNLWKFSLNPTDEECGQFIIEERKKQPHCKVHIYRRIIFCRRGGAYNNFKFNIIPNFPGNSLHGHKTYCRYHVRTELLWRCLWLFWSRMTYVLLFRMTSACPEFLLQRFGLDIHAVNWSRIIGTVARVCVWLYILYVVWHDRY
jgi:hypothetical protein